MTEDQKALDRDAGEGEHLHHPRQTAGQDKSIAERLERDPESPDAKLDNALDESMDASDPPASSPPGAQSEPPVSSGYDADAERKIQSEKSA